MNKNGDREPRWNPAMLRAQTDEDFLAAMIPGGIEAQEKRGQQQMVASAMLPKKIEGSTRANVEALGIVFGADVDDLFINVTLPEGWKLEATDHSMWSSLLDEKGRKRAAIFYKAAFYDRSAFMSLNCRYRIGSSPCDSTGKIIDWEIARTLDPRYNSTLVFDCEKIIHCSGFHKSTDYQSDDEQRKAASAWLDKNFSDWKNPLAHWRNP